jgi:glycyl-tRNA synthetase beta chain
LGFAASCGVPLDQLQQADGPKGRVLQFVATRQGALTANLIPAIVNASLDALPIAKRMRWGNNTMEFVRPVHWVVMLLGSSTIDATVLGIRAGRDSRGHRFHAPGPLPISVPSAYEEVLRAQGRVVVDVAERRESIRSRVNQIAEALGGTAVVEPALLDEVTSLVEWPVPLAGRFDVGYLQLPAEVLIATMQDHQRYFPVRTGAGGLLNAFITVANIESRDPDKVRDGNERVVRPRLADAAFFWETDRKQPLAAHRDSLKAVTFQNKLGSVADKVQRVTSLAAHIAESLRGDTAMAIRAGELSKCDLLSAMVGEFPELQGLMGRYYAMHDGEAAEVATAIEEQYWPRFSGDQLPSTPTGIALAMADKLDTLAGIFAIGQKPTGTRDPFGLRRAALGVLRICAERELDLDLLQLVHLAASLQPVAVSAETIEEIWHYLLERLRSAYLENVQSGVTTEMFDAVIASHAISPYDIELRLRALKSFLTLPEAESLAGANKRIANILRKAPDATSGAVETVRLIEAAERSLFEHVLIVERVVNPLLARREYQQALSSLATLRDQVDGFFDAVMVMAEDPAVRANRLALLVRLRSVFLQIADLSRLPG